MNQFYVSIIFIGIIIITISFIWIILDKRREESSTKLLDDKREQVVLAINDAEEIVLEMDKFADYIAEKIDEDGKKIDLLIKAADERIGILSKCMGDVMPIPAVPNTISIEKKEEIEASWINESEEKVILEIAGQATQSMGKVIPIKSRYSEVLNLWNNGVSEMEIAKKLKMGKGEIQLIVGLNASKDRAKTG